MGHNISFNKNHRNFDEWVSMSNGLTSVFITTLVISGSIIAKTEHEKELIVFFAENDINKIGDGVGDFYITDIPWKVESFDEDKKFLISVIDGALSRLGWGILEYEPKEDWVFDRLNKFKNLILMCEKKDIDKNRYKEWKNVDCEGYSIPEEFPKCNKHGVLLYWGGCIICNCVILG